jgi:hypothetical protein
MGKSQISPSRISTCLAKKLHFFLFMLFLLVKKRLRDFCFYAFPSHKFCVHKLKLVDGFPLIQVKIKIYMSIFESFLLSLLANVAM